MNRRAFENKSQTNPRRQSRHNPGKFARNKRASSEDAPLTQVTWYDDELTYPAPLPQVRLRCRRDSAHPWIFRRMLEAPKKGLKPGILVEALALDGTHLGRGLYNPHSEIALRLLTSHPDENPDLAWFERAITRAVSLRHEILRLPDRTDAYRLIHAEGDGLSGLVVDRFANALAVEIFCAGMRRHFPWVKAALLRHFPGAALCARPDARAEQHEHVSLAAPSDEVERTVIEEHGVRFEVDLRSGHKTGFFVDQRDNRRDFALLCRGEELLDLCCYTGGFALAALKAGARRAEGIDLDEAALALARSNAALNGHAKNAPLEFRHVNLFDYLRTCRERSRTFSRIVLDPPKLAGAKSELAKGLTAYADMNRLAIECVADGGLLLTCSCSGLVSEEMFLNLLAVAARRAGRDLQILRITGAGEDHPVAARAPEGRYLKAVYCRVGSRPWSAPA